MKIRRVLAIIAALAILSASPSILETPALRHVAALRQTAAVAWHAQQAGLGNTGQVEGAEASLVRSDNGISFQIRTNSLTPGNAYTLWLVVVDNPAACDPKPCTAPDIIGDPATGSQVRYAAGHVAGGSGSGTFSGAAQEGPLSGWLPDRELSDAIGAEVHLVINDHGPALATHMPDMIRTYRGGCADSSPFPPIFPPSALGDGEPGPNTCRLFQAAVLVAP